MYNTYILKVGRQNRIKVRGREVFECYEGTVVKKKLNNKAH